MFTLHSLTFSVEQVVQMSDKSVFNHFWHTNLLIYRNVYKKLRMFLKRTTKKCYLIVKAFVEKLII